MSLRLERLLLLSILLCAVVLRIYALHGVPPGVQHDEVFSANFATQILEGARPVYFDQNGGVMALYAYLVAPAFALFGAHIVTLRMVSVLCGVLSILCTYGVARRMFGAQVALLSAALLTVSHWHLFESRVGLEPVALLLLSSATAWAFWRLGPVTSIQLSGASRQEPVVGSQYPVFSVQHLKSSFQNLISNLKFSIINPYRNPHRTLRWLVCNLFVGALLGLTAYTYHSSPFVFVAFVVFGLYQWVWKRALFKMQWRAWFVMLAMAALLSAPLAWHVLTTPGDATSRTEDLAADVRAAFAGDLEPLSQNIGGVLGMFAFRGDPSWRYNLSERPVFTFALGLFAYIGLIICVRRWRDPRYAFVVIWIVCNVLGSALTRASPSFLRSTAALPFIALLPAIALVELRYWLMDIQSQDNAQPARFSLRALIPRPLISTLMAANASARLPSLLLVLLLSWEAASTLTDYFTLWAPHERVRSIYRADLASVAAYLDQHAPTGMVMMSARFAASLDQQALYLWQDSARRYQWFNGRRIIVFPHDPTGQGVNYIIPATNESLSDGAALLSTLEKRATVLDEQGKPFFTHYYVPSAQLQALRNRAPQIAIRANANREAELLGVDVQVAQRNVHLLLYWRVQQNVRGDLDRSFFAHLLDAQGQRVVQEDRSVYPTSSWRTNDIAWQWYDLKLPDNAPNGEYWLNLGIYDANAPTLPRVPILDAAGNVVSDHVRVGPIVVQ